jgi:predicted dehydrogenase
LKKLKVGVIGIGHLGRLHASMYSQIPQAQLVGVYDTDLQRCQQVAAEFNTKCFTDIDQLLAEIEAASIAVPTSIHFPIAKAVLEKGIHCLIEKPITKLVEEADQLIQLAKQKNLLIQIGHVERFNPAILALNNDDLNPLFIESHRLASFNPRGTDVAVVLDLMIHDIDIILSLIKSPVKTIDASGVTVISDEVDIANARIQFQNGAVANVTASRISQKKMRKMRLFQRNAYISIDFLDKICEIYRLVGADAEMLTKNSIPIQMAELNGKKIIYERPHIDEINSLQMELASFIDVVQHQKQPIVSGQDGREALRVAMEITRLIDSQTKALGISLK